MQGQTREHEFIVAVLKSWEEGKAEARAEVRAEALAEAHANDVLALFRASPCPTPRGSASWPKRNSSS
jgi:hypothetical protein